MSGNPYFWPATSIGPHGTSLGSEMETLENNKVQSSAGAEDPRNMEISTRRKNAFSLTKYTYLFLMSSACLHDHIPICTYDRIPGLQTSQTPGRIADTPFG